MRGGLQKDRESGYGGQKQGRENRPAAELPLVTSEGVTLSAAKREHGELFRPPRSSERGYTR
jgi:hypothetical protein